MFQLAKTKQFVPPLNLMTYTRTLQQVTTCSFLVCSLQWRPVDRRVLVVVVYASTCQVEKLKQRQADGEASALLDRRRRRRFRRPSETTRLRLLGSVSKDPWGVRDVYFP